MRNLKSITLTALFAVILPQVASAGLGSSFKAVIISVVGELRTVLIVASVLLFIVAAYYYLTAGGDTEKTSTANKMIIWGAVGLGVGMLSGVLANALCSIFAGAGGAGTCGDANI